MKKFKYIIVAFLALNGLAGCDESDHDAIDLSADVDILSFKVNGSEAIIDNKALTIELTLPPKTDLTALAPVIEIPEGATIEPATGVEMDFSNSASNPIEYTVYHKNIYNTYKVKVEDLKAKITSFKIGSVAGTINETTKIITIYLPAGTDVSAVFPTILFTKGAEISPSLDEAIDLSQPVVYTLTYAGAEFQYTVNAVVGSAPYTIFDGEDGSNPWWNVGGATVEVVGWLQKDEVNGSNYGATIWRTDENDSWAGGGITFESELDISAYNKISIDINKIIPGTVRLELQCIGKDNAFLAKDYTPNGHWQTLVFDIPEGWTKLKSLLVAPHEVNTHDNPIPTNDNENHRMSWDNVILIPK